MNTKLQSLSKSDIETGAFPLDLVLSDSLYYPACELDGQIVKHFSKEYQSFIFCDYAVGEDAFNAEIEHFKGYQLVGHRSLKQEELVPNGWSPELPPHLVKEEYLKYQQHLKKPFAHWAVYERMEGFDENHGAKRFSLLFVGGEGAATYQALYWSNHKTAKALAIIQPGTGFGLNYTDFRDSKRILGWVVLNNKSGIPDKLIYGGNGDNYTELNWEGYTQERTISPYYNLPDHPEGEVRVWKR